MKKRATAKKKGNQVNESEDAMRNRIAENVLHTLGEGPQAYFHLLTLATGTPNPVVTLRNWLGLVQNKRKQDLMKMFNDVCK